MVTWTMTTFLVRIFVGGLTIVVTTTIAVLSLVVASVVVIVFIMTVVPFILRVL